MLCILFMGEIMKFPGLCCLKTVGSNEVIYFMSFCESTFWEVQL
jgi:hypothetical protein